MQLVVAAAGAGMASWGVSSGVLASSYLGMSTVGLGFSLGGMLGSYLFAPKGPDMQGPRLQDKSVQGSAYGTFIPIVYGRMRIAGNIIWATKLQEVANEEDGGKGAGSYTTYTYFANFAVALCEGEIDGIRKIWADGRLIYNKSVDNTGYTGDNGTMTFYNGSETQEPDAFMESKLGVGNVPAYRGIAYCVFDNFELTKYGNRIPNLTFEVVKGQEVFPNIQYMATTSVTDTTIAGAEAVDIDNERVWYVDSDGAPSTGGNNYLKCYDFTTGTKLYDLTYPQVVISPSPYYEQFNQDAALLTNTNTNVACYLNNKVYIAPYSLGSVMYYANADTGAIEGYFNIPKTGLTLNLGFIKYDRYTEKLYLHNTSGDTAFMSVSPDSGVNMSVANPRVNVPDMPLSATSDITFAKVVIGIDPTTMLPLLDSNIIVSALGYTNSSKVFSSNEAYNLGSTTPYIAEIPHNGAFKGSAYDEQRDVIIMIEDDGASAFKIRTFSNIDFELINEKSINGLITSSFRVFHHTRIDKYVVANNSSPTVYFYLIDPESLEVTYPFTGTVAGSSYFIPWGMAETNQAYMIAGGATSQGEFTQVPFENRISVEDILLKDIVEDIASRAGLESGDIDVSEMTEPVTGYAITKQAAARAALEPLMTAYHYDAVES